MFLIPTLHCGGRCAEVIELYKKAFHLEVDWQGKDEKNKLYLSYRSKNWKSKN